MYTRGALDSAMRHRSTAAMGAFIAATAAQHQLTLVIRNTPDFEGAGVRLFNPRP
jgi:predicted nucleic acid-binding protein